MMKNRLLFLLLGSIMITGLLFVSSCSDDDEKPKFTIDGTPLIVDDGYTGEGTLTVMYSTDGGATFSPIVPKVTAGTVIQVKITNGSENVTSDDYEFDWTGTSPAPSDIHADIVSITVGKDDVTISVSIEDIWVLLTSQRSTGKFFTLNTTTGAKTESFTIMNATEAVTGIRGFVYHPNQNKFFATTSTEEGGIIYSINATTKQATIINDNIEGEDPEWYGLANLAVMEDDSLLAIGWMVDPEVNILTKFGTNGMRSASSVSMNYCCGLAMLYDYEAEEVTISDDPSDGEMYLIVLDMDGEEQDTYSIDDLNDFPTDVSEDWIPTKTLTKDKDGTIYGIMFNSETKETYLVKVDLETPSVTYIGTLGIDNNQFNSLAFVPKHTL